MLLNVQGLSLRDAGAGHYTLYAANHGGRESIEVFGVDAKPGVPALTWQGCVMLPPSLAANSVAAYSDGTLLVTVLAHPGCTCADDSGFFVVAFGRHAILRYSRDDPSAPPVQSMAPGFMPDNIHRDGGRLLTAGMVYDEPACGGIRKVIDGKADEMKCHRGTVVAELDPGSMNFRIIAYSPPDPVVNGASAAVIIGKQLWVASYQSDCLAYRTLPWL
jgi:hypothetical protein